MSPNEDSAKEGDEGAEEEDSTVVKKARKSSTKKKTSTSKKAKKAKVCFIFFFCFITVEKWPYLDAFMVFSNPKLGLAEPNIL